MRSLLTHRVLFLPLMVAALAIGCETPPPDEGRDRLFASPAESTVFQNAQTTITITSVKANGDPGGGDVIATIAQVGGADIAAIAPADTPPTEVTATAKLGDTGTAIFDFRCTGLGDAKIEVTGATGTANLTIACVEQRDIRAIAIVTDNCTTFLQADGTSTCAVQVTLRNEAGALFTDIASLSVVVDAAVAVGAGTANDRVLKSAVNAVASNRLDNVQTDANGAARFFIASPTFGLEEAIDFTVNDDAGNSRSASVVIAPFVDKSSVALSATATFISSGDSTSITVTGVDVNGAPAISKPVAITVAAGLTPTVGGCLTVDGVAFEAVLDATGRCTFDATAGTVDADLQTTISATFQPLEGRGLAARTATIIITTSPEGVVLANVTADPLVIFADAEPSVSTITTAVKLDGQPLPGATVAIVVANESRGVIRLLTQRVGAAGAPAAVASDTDGSAITVADGIIAFTATKKTATSRGNGKLTVTIRDAAGALVGAPRVINVTVDRQPLLSSLVFDSFDPTSVIGVPGGPLASSTGVAFRLLDEENKPVPNVPVRFEVGSSVPGIAFIPNAVSNASGVVKTVITAGRVAGPITVIANVDAPNPVLRAVAPAVSVVGGLPNSAYSALVCDKVAVRDPFTANCTVSLADKFTNIVETSLNVQFRAEGGNITPSAVASGGSATGVFSFSQPGPGSADVARWSYSPLRNAPAVVRTAFPGCFDNTTRTPCDLLALCSPAANDPNRTTFEAFCPLPPSVGGAGLCSADISATTRQALVDENANPADWELELFFPGLDPLPGVNVAAQFAAYTDEHRLCGMPVSCLTGRLKGLFLDETDNCAVNAGCLDFSGATECPQDGLLNIIAAVRGEEGFDDENGNGVHDANESFIDFPEPFLDKNSSCSFDSLNNNPALSPSQKVALSDLFIDSDPADGQFGFVQNGVRTETNGIPDTDTEIFVSTNIIRIGPAALQFGEVVGVGACGGDGTDTVTCLTNETGKDRLAAAGGATSSRCKENARGGDALLQDCKPLPEFFRDKETVTLGFRWADASGNCPSENFAGTPSVTATGPVIITADDSAFSQAECGASPGAINVSNPDRPWCEEHPDMGAPIRTVSVTADCGGEEGDVLVKLTFELDGQSVVKTFFVGCPKCGDNRKEGDEECDQGPVGDATCDDKCKKIVAP